MRRKHILFFVDHKWRDLLSSVYIKLLLEKRGYRVTLARNGFERFILPVLQPDAVIFNHVYEDKRVNLIKRFVSNGLKVIILPTENIPVLDKVKQLFAGELSDMSTVNMCFLWNNAIADVIRDDKTFDLQRTRVIGVPRFDIYKNPILGNLITGRSAFLAKYGLNIKYPVITMTTNFVMSGFAHKNREFLEKDIKGLKTDKLGYNQQIALKDFESKELFLQTFLRLINDYPETNFIIKPHPSEDHTPYYGILEKLKNSTAGRVAVVLTEFIWDVLNATDILLERSCLTGIEAWIMGKPTIELHINPDEWYHSPEMASGSDEVKSYEHLCQRINYYLNGGEIAHEVLRNRERVIELWCDKIDGKASLRFVDEVDKFLKGEQYVARKFCWSDIKTYMLYYAFIYPDYRLLDMKLYKNRGKKIDKLGRTDKYFRAGDIRYWEERIRPLL